METKTLPRVKKLTTTGPLIISSPPQNSSLPDKSLFSSKRDVPHLAIPGCVLLTRVHPPKQMRP